jgi:hypothetical protein
MPTSPQASLQVTSTIDDLYNRASGAIASAETALETLAGMEIPISMGPTTPSIGTFIPFSINAPMFPAPLVVTGEPGVDGLIFPSPVSKPGISIPSAPVLGIITLPDKPSLNSPTLDIVTLGTLLDLQLPDKPDVVLSGFNVNAPDELVVSAQAWSFSIDNILIADDPMVEAIMDRLTDNIVNGGTGLTPEIEDAIWKRDLERMELQLSDTTTKVTSMWAKKGWSLPDGLLAHSLSEVQKEYMNKRIDRSREISIEQAKLEQANLFKSIELAVSVAFKLIDALEKYQALILSVQENTAKYANEYIKLQIEIHNNKIDLYKARVQAYEILIRAAMVEVDIYKAQLEGELAKVNINSATVKIYSEQISASLAKYKGVLEGNQIISQIFNTEMQGALAQANIQESQVKIYAEKIRAVQAQVDVYKAEVGGYTAEIEAEKTKIDANIARITAWAKTVDAKIAVQNLNIESVRATGQFNISTAEIMNKATEQLIKFQVSEAELQTSNAEITSRAITAKGNAMVEAARGVAAATASMASGAMAAVSAHASIGYSESMSLTEV